MSGQDGLFHKFPNLACIYTTADPVPVLVSKHSCYQINDSCCFYFCLLYFRCKVNPAVLANPHKEGYKQVKVYT